MDTLFTAVVQPNTPDNTLNADDQIIGGENAENHLQVTLKGDFMDGMDSTSSLQNIQQVDLVNPNNQQYQFNAQNTTSVDNWQLINTSNQSGSIELYNLPKTGITVGINGQVQGAANIGFVPTIVTGNNDAMTIELENVGRVATKTNPQTVVNLNTEGVENLTLVSNGTARNLVDLTKFAQATNLIITGEADLSIIPSGNGKDALPTPLQSIDATAATGDITITTDSPLQLKNVAFGSGDDNFNITNGTSVRTISMGAGDDTITAQTLYSMATINGEGGNDTLVFNGSTGGNYHLNMNGVETMTVKANSDALVFDASNTHDLATLNLINEGAAVSYVKANQANITVNVTSTDGTIGLDKVNTIGGVQNITVNLNGTTGNSTTPVDFTNDLVSNDAQSLTLNTGNYNTWTGAIDAKSVSTLTLNTGTTIDTNSAITLEATGSVGSQTTDLANVSTLIATGRGNVSLGNYYELGADQSLLTVQAGGLDGNLIATFAGGSDSHRINITGSATGSNTLQIGGAGYGIYDEQIRVDGSTGDDYLSIYIESVDALMNMVDAGRFNLTLLTGDNTVNFYAFDGTAPLYISLADFLDLNEVITGEGLDHSDVTSGSYWGLTITA